MSTEQNKATVRRLFLESVNTGNLGVADELVAPGYTYHDPAEPLHGPDGWKSFVGMYRAAFPDLQMTIEDLIAEGETVVVRYSVRGTHQGELQGIPPTGKPCAITGISVCRLADGKVIDEWENFDALAMMQQIGAIPSPEPATA